MDLYFNISTHKLYLLKRNDIPKLSIWEQPVLFKVQDFDIDNIEVCYNILYSGGNDKSVKCVENIDTFKQECNKMLELFNSWSDEDVFNNSDFEYSEENNSTKFTVYYYDFTIIYFENIEIENSCFLK